MKCPMTFSDPCSDRDERCREDCAWRVSVNNGARGARVVCAVAAVAASVYLGFEGYPARVVNYEKEGGANAVDDGNTIREQREKNHELQGLFKQCANRYADVFAACGMEAPAIFTSEQHEELLNNIAGLRAAGAMVEERCREMANGALEVQATINEDLLKRNAELETLVLDMWHLHVNPIGNSLTVGDSEDWRRKEVTVRQRMTELGIEVPR